MGEHTAPEQTPQPLAWLTPARRRWLYAILVALAPLAVAYGIVEQDQAALWLAVASTVLLGGTAIAHVPREAAE